MPSDPEKGDVLEEERSQESKLATCWAGVSIVTGILLIVTCVVGLKSEAIWELDKIVTYDSAESGEMTSRIVLTNMRIFQVLLFVGLAVVLSGIVGIAGSTSRRKGFVCCYTVSTSACAVVMLVAAIQATERKAVVEPLITRQVDDLCNATTYVQLGKQMNCEWSAKYSPTEIPACGATCQYRAETLKMLQGCDLMPRLCQSFHYKALPTGSCLQPGAMPPSSMFGASLSEIDCRQECDEDIMCTEYGYSKPTQAKPELCLLFAGIAATHQLPQWSTMFGLEAMNYLGSDKACYERSEPMILDRFRIHTTRLAYCTIVLAILLVVSASCAFSLMYNISHRRVGKPSSNQLAAMMCCPCYARRIRKRFNRPEVSDSEELSSDSGESSA